MYSKESSAVNTAMNNHWMPIYIGDYHRKTRHLTAEQHGGYLLLLMEYWSRGSLPDDDAQLARMAGMTGARWHRNRATLQALFVDGWKHPQLDALMNRAAEMSAKYSARARKGAEARHEKAKGPVESSQNATHNSPFDETVKTEKAQSFQGGDVASSNPQAVLEAYKSKSKSDSLPSEEREEPQAAPSLPLGDKASPKPKKRKGRAPSPATYLPDDWKPGPEYIAVAKDHGLTDLDIQRDAVKFRNYFTREKRQARKDWLATWENWVIRTAESLGRVPVAAAPARPAAPSGKWSDDDSEQYATWDSYIKALGKVGASVIDARPDGPDTPIRRGYRFESEYPPEPPGMVFVPADSTAFAEWKAFPKWKAFTGYDYGKEPTPRLCRVGGQTKKGCWFKSEFPPHQQAEQMALAA
jgi:uncharacterized protein YdaU (DUF1376 family)